MTEEEKDRKDLEHLEHLYRVIDAPLRFQAALLAASMLEKGYKPEAIATQFVESKIEQDNPTEFLKLFLKTFLKDYQEAPELQQHG